MYSYKLLFSFWCKSCAQFSPKFVSQEEPFDQEKEKVSDSLKYYQD